METLTVDVAREAARAGATSLVASGGGRLERELGCAGVRSVRLPLNSRNPLVVAANIGRLQRLIEREAVSVVHVRSRAPAFSAIAAARRAGRPVVATYHGIYSARTPLKRWYNGVMTRGDAVIANSAFTRDHILAEHALPSGRIVVIPEGVDTSVFDPSRLNAARLDAVRHVWRLAPSDRRPIVLLPGRFADWKGHRLAIEALGAALGQGALLVCCGPGGAAREDELRAAARASGLGESLRLVGVCADMPAAFALADLVISSSTQPESFGRGVAEAGAMARPVLASNLGGPAETVQHGLTGWLAPSGDAAAWAQAFQIALRTPAPVRAEMGAAARSRIVAHYSLEAMCRATFDLYLRLDAARRP